MANIPGLVFILIGLVVAGVSFYINSVQKGMGMIVFVFVGIVFVLWGIAKVQKII
ncbi:hypothetical protein HYU11_04890 [Candidatus Woesearchaeota archaeon]|nr:hypothetical protein [Candidatus Woesearchaeota archaeon]